MKRRIRQMYIEVFHIAHENHLIEGFHLFLYEPNTHVLEHMHLVGILQSFSLCHLRYPFRIEHILSGVNVKTLGIPVIGTVQAVLHSVRESLWLKVESDGRAQAGIYRIKELLYILPRVRRQFNFLYHGRLEFTLECSLPDAVPWES